METIKEQETLGQQLGRLGGLKTSKRHGKAHYLKMAQASARVRRLKAKGKRPFQVGFTS